MRQCFAEILQIGGMTAANRAAANNKICPSHSVDPNPKQPENKNAPVDDTETHQTHIEPTQLLGHRIVIPYVLPPIQEFRLVRAK